MIAFEKHLEDAAPLHFSSLYTVLAKEEFIRKQAIEKLVFWVLKEENSKNLCLQLFDAEKEKIETVLQELQTLSFFAKKRLLIIQNAEALDKSSTTRLEAYFLSPNPTICLAIIATTINRATTFYKKAEKAGIVLDVAEEKPWEKERTAAEWLYHEATRHKKSLPLAICQQMVKQLGTNQTLLHSELQKLLCYIGDKPKIEGSDVAAICTRLNVENVWQLGEAIFRRDAATALRVSRGLLDEGVAIFALLRQIRTQFQTEYQVCSILNDGGSHADVTQEFPYMKGTILDRHVNQAQHYGIANFKKGLLTIDATELQAKNSAVDPEFLLDMLIIKLVT